MPRLAFDIEARLAAFEAGLAKINQSTTQMASRLEGAFSGLQSTFAALSGVIAGGALATLVRNFADAGDQLNKLSQKTGVAVEKLSELQYAAKLNDVGNEQLGDAFRKLSVNMQEAARGTGDAKDAFVALGISQKELRSLAPDQVFARIAESFSKIQDGAGKTELAVKLFGRSGSELIPLLNAGSEGLNRMGEEARKLGVVISADTAAKAEAFNDNLTRLSTSLQGLGQSLAGPVLSGLSQLVEEMTRATTQGGILAGVLQGLGSLGKIALQGGVDGDAIAKQRAYILEIRGEIAKLQDSISGNGALGTGLIDRLIYGDSKTKFNKLSELKITLADAEKALANMQRRTQPSPEEAKRAAPLLPNQEAIKAAQSAAEKAYQEALSRGKSLSDAELRDLEQKMDEMRRIAEERGRYLETLLQEGPKEAERQAAALRSAVDARISATPAGQRQGLNRQLEELNERLIKGQISAQEYEDTFAGISKELSSIKDIGDDVFDSLTFKTDEWTRRLQAAIEGWGNATADAITQMVRTGKLEFGSLVDTILSDLVRLTVQQTITRPLFTAFANALGGLNLFGGSTASSAGTPFGFNFGGGKAVGGAVAGGTTYLVGERGPELFTAPANGAIVPNGGFGGVTYQQTVVINAPTDGATIRAAVLQGAALARADLGRMARIGGMS